jgi:hypothetical protein
MPATATPIRPVRPDYPRPPVDFRHHILFREPVYTDGRPYGQDDDGEGGE